MSTKIRFDGKITDENGRVLPASTLRDLEKAKELGRINDRDSLRSLAIISRVSIRHLEEAFHEGREGAKKVTSENT